MKQLSFQNFSNLKDNEVYIEWIDKDASDWRHYKILEIDYSTSPTMILLQGLDQENIPFIGQRGWVPLSSIGWIGKWKEKP